MISLAMRRTGPDVFIDPVQSVEVEKLLAKASADALDAPPTPSAEESMSTRVVMQGRVPRTFRGLPPIMHTQPCCRGLLRVSSYPRWA